ncbi:MAG: DUF494 domain-containing protein [Melioribacteraceae bacterium]|nr:DUF494 domain-containing protein [Melioribacteraceae bacterium]
MTPSKIIEVLAKILDYLNKNYTLDEVNSKLIRNKRFDSFTLSTAYSLIFDKVLSKRLNNFYYDNKPGEKFRIFTEEEKNFIGEENLNYIMYLANVGLLDISTLEMILEQLMLFPADKITKNDINWLIYISLIEFNSDILPGSRLLLDSHDTIN